MGEIVIAGMGDGGLLIPMGMGGQLPYFSNFAPLYTGATASWSTTIECDLYTPDTIADPLLVSAHILVDGVVEDAVILGVPQAGYVSGPGGSTVITPAMDVTHIKIVRAAAFPPDAVISPRVFYDGVTASTGVYPSPALLPTADVIWDCEPEHISGVTMDDQGTFNEDGTLNGSPTQILTPENDGALVFNGSSYVTGSLDLLPHLTNDSPVSFAVRFRADAIGSGAAHKIIAYTGQSGINGRGIGLQLGHPGADSKLSVFIGTGGTFSNVCLSSTSLVLGSWYDAVVVFNGLGNCSLYLNGVLDVSDNTAGSVLAWSTGSASARYTRMANGNTTSSRLPFIGAVADERWGFGDIWTAQNAADYHTFVTTLTEQWQFTILPDAPFFTIVTPSNGALNQSRTAHPIATITNHGAPISNSFLDATVTIDLNPADSAITAGSSVGDYPGSTITPVAWPADASTIELIRSSDFPDGALITVAMTYGAASVSWFFYIAAVESLSSQFWPSAGGFKIELSSTAVADGEYYVHVGPAGDATDPQMSGSRPSSLRVTFKNNKAIFYTNQLIDAIDQIVTIHPLTGPAITRTLDTPVHVTKPCLRPSTYRLRSQFAEVMAVGPRSAEEEE